MVNRILELPLDHTGVVLCRACHQHTLTVVQQAAGNPNNLLRSLACPENHFWKSPPERPVRIHPGKAQVSHWRVLKRPEDFIAANTPGAKLFK
jgi:hypothetical protein